MIQAQSVLFRGPAFLTMIHAQPVAHASALMPTLVNGAH